MTITTNSSIKTIYFLLIMQLFSRENLTKDNKVKKLRETGNLSQ